MDFKTDIKLTYHFILKSKKKQGFSVEMAF